MTLGRVVLAGILGLLVCPTLVAQSDKPPLTADDLFNPNVLHDVYLTINSRDWRDLKDAFRENTYYLADLRWCGLVVRNLGVRSRGNGSRDGTKPGLRLDFDRYSSKQEFLGLKSLVLDNHRQDPTMMIERLAMRFYNEMGIPAPRVVHARLFVNNTFVGLYAIVEPIDKRFLKRRFDENDGYLYEYKYADRYGFEDLGSTLEPYAEFFEPKTHERDSMFALYHPIREMVRAFNESSDSLFTEAAGEFIDLPGFLTYAAVDNFLADHDGLLGEWGMNNFYLYRFEEKKLSQLIPWDKDGVFWAPDYDVWSNVDGNVLMRRALQNSGLRQVYLEALKRCAELALRQPEVVPPPTDEDDPDGEEPEDPPEVRNGPGWLEREVTFVYSQIKDAALEDDAKPFSNERFEEEIEKVLRFARERPGLVMREVDKTLAEIRR